jgi:radical SAM/Cys-rich protein
MSQYIMQMCLNVVKEHRIPILDITGGAPEMVPHFKWLVEEARALGAKVMDRCNLTIIQANPKYHYLPEFFAEHEVHVISSLPYFSKSRTDSQRGDGVFEDSIKALKKLNDVGYGIPGSGLQLDLVYNPTGAFLPASQESLEKEFKAQLLRRYQVKFNSLFCITNIPISRFLEYLITSENYEDYMVSLHQAFNPATIDGLMCRSMISVDYNGYLYDCDFNQMLDLRVATKSQHIRDFDAEALAKRQIVVNQHCYGCTAGAGSSCGGEIA